MCIKLVVCVCVHVNDASQKLPFPFCRRLATVFYHRSTARVAVRRIFAQTLFDIRIVLCRKENKIWPQMPSPAKQQHINKEKHMWKNDRPWACGLDIVSGWQPLQ